MWHVLEHVYDLDSLTRIGSLKNVFWLLVFLIVTYDAVIMVKTGLLMTYRFTCLILEKMT